MSNSRHILLFIFSLALLLQCGSPPNGNVDGGSVTDVGNAFMKGALVDNQGSPAPSIAIQVIPTDHDPVHDPVAPDSLKDTTDAGGNYELPLVPAGSYNLIGVSQVNGERVLTGSIAG